jgi:hypothetical protein
MLDLPSRSTLKGYMKAVPRKEGLAVELIALNAAKLKLQEATLRNECLDALLACINALWLGCISFDGMKTKRSLKFSVFNGSFSGIRAKNSYCCRANRLCTS